MKPKSHATYGTFRFSPGVANRLLKSWSHVETPSLALRFPSAARTALQTVRFAPLSTDGRWAYESRASL